MKEEFKGWINNEMFGCVRRDAASASLLSAPEIRETDECVIVCIFLHAIYFKSGPMALSNMTLTLFYHPSADVMSTLVDICSKGFIGVSNIWRWGTYAARLRSLMVRSPWGFSSIRNMFLYFLPLVASTQTIVRLYSNILPPYP